jgi:hypothetical protein
MANKASFPLVLSTANIAQCGLPAYTKNIANIATYGTLYLKVNINIHLSFLKITLACLAHFDYYKHSFTNTSESNGFT